MKRIIKVAFLVLLASTFLSFNRTVGAHLASFFAQGKVDYVRDIQPIFQAHCAQCHGAEKQSSKLSVLNKSSIARVIVPGNSKDSRLLHRILGLNGEERMPRGGDALKPEQIALIQRWIDEGADFPATASIELKTRKHWSLITPTRPPIPTVKNKAWVRNPIDNFILARLEKENIKPSPEADRATLLRRLSLDLTGLLPTPEELAAFLKDK